MTPADARLWMQITRLAGFVAIWISIGIHRWRLRRLKREAENWPSIDGRMHDGKVEPSDSGNRSVASFYYDYFLGEYRCGTYQQEFQKEQQAQDFVSQMKDKHVTVRYNPSNPDESVVDDKSVPAFTSAAQAS